MVNEVWRRLIVLMVETVRGTCSESMIDSIEEAHEKR